MRLVVLPRTLTGGGTRSEIFDARETTRNGPGRQEDFISLVTLRLKRTPMIGRNMTIQPTFEFEFEFEFEFGFVGLGNLRYHSGLKVSRTSDATNSVMALLQQEWDCLSLIETKRRKAGLLVRRTRRAAQQ